MPEYPKSFEMSASFTSPALVSQGAIVGRSSTLRCDTHDPEVVIAAARGWLATPYRHQTSVRSLACDCLGLIRGVWRELNGTEPEECPAYTPSWAEEVGDETLLFAAQRHLVPSLGCVGDVILMRWRAGTPAKHAAIIVEPNRIIHAYDSAGEVVESSFSPWWKRHVVASFAFPKIVPTTPTEDGTGSQ